MALFLLDTNALFFLFAEVPKSLVATEAVLDAANDGRVIVSSVSA